MIPILRSIARPCVVSSCCLGLVLQTAGAALAGPAEFDHIELAETARSKFILPGYTRFGLRLRTLEKTLAGLCETPSTAALARVRAAYRRAIAAWGRIEIISFGPVAQDNRFERIFYWPDRKGIGRRQVTRLLTAKSPDVLAARGLASKSVALQGLGALEVVLYGGRSKELTASGRDGFACRYAMSIGANLSNINAQVLAGWRPGGAFAKIWRSPGARNPAYLKNSETTLELVKALDHGLENLRDRRIAPVLGFGGNRRRKSRPVLWRSKLSMVIIHANIVGLRDLFVNGGLSDAYIDSKPDQGRRAADLVMSIKSEFDLTIGMVDVLLRKADPFALPDIKQRLVPIGFPLRNIRHNAVTELQAAAGLAKGFNAADGD